MPSPRPVRDRLFAHALAAYAETLLEGRRVLLLGEADRGLGERMLELGARAVHLFDPDARRVRAAEEGERTRGLVVQALPDGDFDVRDGAFDVAIVPDLAALGDTVQWLSRLRRVLGRDGLLLCATASEVAIGRAAIPYADFYDALALQFAEVRLLGSVPWAGIALAALGGDADSTDVSIDTQLAGTPPAPEAFIAIASQVEFDVEPYVIVQLPPEDAPPAPAREPVPVAYAEERHSGDVDDDAPRSGVDAAAFAEMQLRAEVLAKELERTRETEQRLAAELEGLRASSIVANQADHEELDRERRVRKKLELEVSLLQEELQGLRSVQRRTDIEETVSIGGDLSKALGLVAPPPPPSSGSIPTLMPMSGAAVAEIEETETRIASLEAELAAARALGASREEEHAAEVLAFEALLAECAKEIRGLHGEVLHLRRTGRELLVELAQANKVAASAEVTPVSAMPASSEAGEDLRIEAFAVDLARRDGELVALEWRIAELEEKLSMSEGRTARAAGGDVDELREALAQEQALRVEQATLLAQVEARLRELRDDTSTTPR